MLVLHDLWQRDGEGIELRPFRKTCSRLCWRDVEGCWTGSLGYRLDEEEVDQENGSIRTIHVQLCWPCGVPIPVVVADHADQKFGMRNLEGSPAFELVRNTPLDQGTSVLMVKDGEHGVASGY